MEELSLVRDLAVVLAAAGVVAALCARSGQPVVIGYILVGVALGPETPLALIDDPHSIETLATLGVILLLFSVGLEFDFRKLRRYGGTALIAASLEIPLLFSLGFLTAQLAGWDTTGSWFLGSIVSISSTTIILKTVMDLRLTRATFARIITGILIVEDLVVVLLLVVLSGIAAAGTFEPLLLLGAVGRVVVFVVAVTIPGLLVLPRAMAAIGRMDSAEVMTIFVLGTCFAVSLLAASLEFSTALGAFLIGAIFAETKEAHRVAEQIAPVRDVFTAVFFVAVGLQMEPSVLGEAWGVILGLSLLVIVGKFVGGTLGTVFAGHPPRTAVRVGLGLGQIGEFSFVMASLGRAADVVPPSLYSIVVAVSVVTTMTTPWRIRNAGRIAGGLGRRLPSGWQRFLAFYDRRVQEKSRRERLWVLSDEMRPPIVRGLVVSVLLVALLGLVMAAADRLPNLVSHRAGGLEISAWIVWTVGGIASLPLLLSILRSVREFARAVAAALVEGDSATMERGLELAFSIVAGIAILGIGVPLLPSGIPFLLSIVIVVVAGIGFERSLGGIEQAAERRIRELFTGEPTTAPQRANLAELVSERYPFELVLEEVVLPFHLGEEGCTIYDLALRTRTGATVAAIYRDDSSIVNPPPETVLEPGDVVLVLGSKDQIASAVKLLSSPDHFRADEPD